MTTQVIIEKTWTPATVSQRQETLINAFKEGWDLDYVENTDMQEEDAIVFYIKNKRGANAVGYIGSKGFIVKAGSKLSDEVVENFERNYPNAFKLREQLCSNGKIINGVFQEDYEFDSVSLAASVILGRNARGQKEWVDANRVAYDERTNTLMNDGEFHIDDESTYTMVKVGLLAFELFKKIFESGNITDEEIEKLKEKEYTKQLFSKTDYPVLADNREDNQGKSNVVRYRKEPIIYKGRKIYLTTQWFEANRNDVIAWYKKHL